MILQFYYKHIFIKEVPVSDFIAIPRIGEEIRMEFHGYASYFIVKRVVWFMDEEKNPVEIYLEDKD